VYQSCVILPTTSGERRLSQQKADEAWRTGISHEFGRERQRDANVAKCPRYSRCLVVAHADDSTTDYALSQASPTRNVSSQHKTTLKGYNNRSRAMSSSSKSRRERHKTLTSAQKLTALLQLVYCTAAKLKVGVRLKKN